MVSFTRMKGISIVLYSAETKTLSIKKTEKTWVSRESDDEN